MKNLMTLMAVVTMALISCGLAVAQTAKANPGAELDPVIERPAKRLNDQVKLNAEAVRYLLMDLKIDDPQPGTTYTLEVKIGDKMRTKTLKIDAKGRAAVGIDTRVDGGGEAVVAIWQDDGTTRTLRSQSGITMKSTASVLAQLPTANMLAYLKAAAVEIGIPAAKVQRLEELAGAMALDDSLNEARRQSKALEDVTE